jgi:hypothetical protein
MTKKQESTPRRYDPRDSYDMGERIDLGALGIGAVTEVLAWATSASPQRRSLGVTLGDGRVVYFAAGMGEEAPAAPATIVPAALPAGEPAMDASSKGPWRTTLARLIGQEVAVPGSRRRLHVKSVSDDGVLVAAGRGPEMVLPWRSLEVGRRRLRENGWLTLGDLETLVPDVDANLVAALLAVTPGVFSEGKPPTFYDLEALSRDEADSFTTQLRPVYLSKSFISIPAAAWSAVPLPSLGDHTYVPVVLGEAITLCRLSYRDAPREARLYLRDAAGEWLRDHCQENDVLQWWPLRNGRGEFVALAVDRAAG